MASLRNSAALLGLLVLAACGGGGGSSGGSGGSGPLGSGLGGSLVVTSTLSGIVRDKSGTAIVGATISVFHHNDNTTVKTTTDAAGRYSVAGLSTDAADPSQAWTVYSCDFGVYNIPKTDIRYSLAVR